MKFPKISIVTPSFNQGCFLEECINSVLSQNYPNLEYIIMDGGSTDESVEIIKKYEKYLTYWQSTPDGGQYAAIDWGFRRTSGDIMAWINSDDKYHENAFFKVASIFSSYSQVDWITARHVLWDAKGSIKYINCNRLPGFSRDRILRKNYDNPFIMQEGTFWRRSLWEKAGGYLRSDLEFAGDLELWARFFRHAQLYNVDTLLGGYRVHGNQKFSRSPQSYRREAEQIINEELSNFAVDSSFNPPAPEQISFDAEEFVAFMRTVARQNYGGWQSYNSEYLVSYLIRQQESITASRFWRAFRPLRWFWHKIRTIGES